MTRIPLFLAMLSLGACAQRDVSKSMQRSAMQAALQTQLKAAEQEAAPDDFWLGMDPAENVEMADGPLAKPVITAPEPPSDLVEPVDTTADVRGVVTTGAPVAPEAPVVSTAPVVVQPDAPQGLDALSSLRTSGSNAEVVRALDDLRWTMTLEARLEDKQRQIDGLTARLDTPSNSASSKRTTTTGPSAADKAARAEVEALKQRVVAAEQAAKTNAETVAALTARISSVPVEAEGPPVTELAVPVGPSAEMQAIDELRKEIRNQAPAQPNDEFLSAIADLRAQIAGLAAAQKEAEQKSTRRGRRLFRRRAALTAPTKTVVPVVVPTEVSLSKPMTKPSTPPGADGVAALTARIRLLQVERSSLEATMDALEAAGEDDRLERLDTAVEALAADTERVQALEQELSALIAEQTRIDDALQTGSATDKAALATAQVELKNRTATLNAEVRGLRARQLAAEQAYSTGTETLSTRLTPLSDRGIVVRPVNGSFQLELPDDAFDGSTSLTSEGLAHLRALVLALEPFDAVPIKVHGPDGSVQTTPSRANLILNLKTLGRAASPAASIGTPRVALTIEPTAQETP